jgi:hypothetical protein
MSKTPKIVQLIPAPSNLDIVRGETARSAHRNVARITDPVVALALLQDGSIRPVFVECLNDDNVGVLTIGSSDALLSPPWEAKKT